LACYHLISPFSISFYGNFCGTCLKQNKAKPSNIVTIISLFSGVVNRKNAAMAGEANRLAKSDKKEYYVLNSAY
jgi:hypothetical protein